MIKLFKKGRKSCYSRNWLIVSVFHKGPHNFKKNKKIKKMKKCNDEMIMILDSNHVF